MLNDNEVMLKNFYNMPKPDPKYMEERMARVATVIASMGDKYCLAIPVEKKHDVK